MNKQTKLTQNLEYEYSIRFTNKSDAIAIWRLVEGSDTLDHNSFYCYFILSNFFSSTCAVAELEDEIVGFVTGFIAPDQPETYFVWQVRVVEKMRGRGLARSLIEFVLNNLDHKQIQFVEATISPNNSASKNLFSSLARIYNTKIVEDDKYLPVTIFPPEAGIHEQENLFRVGPIQRKESNS